LYAATITAASSSRGPDPRRRTTPVRRPRARVENRQREGVSALRRGTTGPGDWLFRMSQRSGPGTRMGRAESQRGWASRLGSVWGPPAFCRPPNAFLLLSNPPRPRRREASPKAWASLLLGWCSALAPIPSGVAATGHLAVDTRSASAIRSRTLRRSPSVLVVSRALTGMGLGHKDRHDATGGARPGSWTWKRVRRQVAQLHDMWKSCSSSSRSSARMKAVEVGEHSESISNTAFVGEAQPTSRIGRPRVREIELGLPRRLRRRRSAWFSIACLANQLGRCDRADANDRGRHAPLGSGNRMVVAVTAPRPDGQPPGESG
jgi:hypothetical protein